MLGLGFTRRQFIVRCESLPRDRCERVPDQRFQELLEDSLAVGTVGENHDADSRLVEGNGIVAEPFLMPLFEEGPTVRTPIQAPAEAVAQANALVFFGGSRRQAGKLV